MCHTVTVVDVAFQHHQLCVCVCYKHLSYFQGIQGPSGPPGAKGIAGEPVSLLFAYTNVHCFGSIFENQKKLNKVMFFFFVFTPSGLIKSKWGSR